MLDSEDYNRSIQILKEPFLLSAAASGSVEDVSSLIEVASGFNEILNISHIIYLYLDWR